MTLKEELVSLASSPRRDEDRLQILIHLTARIADLLEPAILATAANTEPSDMGEVSDGYHTFNELYAHRRALFLALMMAYPKISWISTFHHDGTSIPEWFIAGMDLPTGQISYHLPAGDWSLACDTGAKIWEEAPEWDGHTANDVVKRLQEWVGRN